MTQLAEKHRNEEVEAKAQAARDTGKLVEQQNTGREESEGQKSPSPGTEAETTDLIEQGGADSQKTSTQLKHQRPQERIVLQKKTKASKTSLDPITLTKGDLHGIGETVRNVTAEAFQ